MPKATIITITYNSAKYVKQAIESILAQSFTDFEYIIGDDCSTDSTWEIINKYKDTRIRKYRNEKNIGEYPNRNKSLEIAKGEYVIWIDGDDIFYPHGLEFMIKMLDAFPNSAMACARPYWKNMVYPYELTPKETYMFDFFGSPVTINGFPDTLFKTDILKKEGGLPENFISGDTFIKRKIAAKHNILLISNGVSWWRITDNQASAKIRNSLFGIIESLEINETLLNDENSPLDSQEKQLALNNIYSAYLRKIFTKTFFKLKIFKYFKLIKKINLPFFRKIKLTFKKVVVNYTGKGTSENPLILDFEKNPFAKK